MRLFVSLVCTAVLIAGAVALVGEVLASGAVPLLIAVGVAAGTLGVWMRAGAPRLGSDGSVLAAVARHAFRGPPPPRGAHWATLRELRQAGFLGEDGWPLGSVSGHTIRLPVERQREGVLMTATTGSGKSAGGVILVLMEESKQDNSEIVLDPKDDLYKTTAASMARTHRVLLFDPSDPDACTVGLDPLATLPDPGDEGFVAEVKQLAQSFFWATRGGEQTTDPFWISQPKTLMEALFLAFLETQPKGTFVELADWARSLKIATFQSVLDRSSNPAVRASAEMLHALGMSDKTIGPIWSDVLQRFDVMDDPRVRRSMAGAPVDESFVTQPTALYLRVGAQDAKRLAPLLSMALGQMYSFLTKIAARSDNKLPREVRVIVDELGNLPRIYGLEIALATLRSYGVGHYMCIQGSSQLVDHYGRQLAETIEDNLVTRIVLGGTSAADAKEFSQRCGESIEYHPHHGWSRGRFWQPGTENFSYTAERRPLIGADEIIHMRDTVLVSTRGISPIRAAIQPYYKDVETLHRLEEDRLAFEQQAGPQPTPVSALFAQMGLTGTPADHPLRDVPPPGCTAQEWDAASASLRSVRWACEDDLFALVTGRVADLDQIRERWRSDPAKSTAARYARITAAEREAAPNVASYVDELALLLGLRQEDDPERGSV